MDALSTAFVVQEHAKVIGILEIHDMIANNERPVFLLLLSMMNPRASLRNPLPDCKILHQQAS